MYVRWSTKIEQKDVMCTQYMYDCLYKVECNVPADTCNYVVYGCCHRPAEMEYKNRAKGYYYVYIHNMTIIMKLNTSL